ncbi:hypothetical protein CK203_107704 [Vitis vinifera]|uniref:Uncharacterized protein n=1 Tax=Vitis vinifera TaxID=29760 RepID=A0A438CQV0_VITVI|nr:hypothetical protein CK203_107704 [Vitis vinifera]
MVRILDSRGGKEGKWTPHFNRPFNDWEMEEVEDCFVLGWKMVRVDEEDRVRWMDSKDEPKLISLCGRLRGEEF